MVTHVATLWEIALASDPTFSSPVAFEFTTVFLTTIPLIGGLMGSTDYLARATYYGSDGSVSSPGPATAFTTLAANTIPEPGTFVAATQGCGDC